MRVAIFGAGVAGLTAAAALHRRVNHCRVYERRHRGAAGGLGFIMSAQALADLQALGLPDTAARAGVPLREFCRYRPDGTLAHTRPMPTGWRGMRRADLVAALRHALPAETMVAGTALTGLTRARDGGVGAALLTNDLDDAWQLRADLYLAADGARSVARQTLYPAWPHRPARVWEVVAYAHDPAISAWAGSDFHKFAIPGLAAGILPVGDDTVVWFIQFDRFRFTPPATPDPTRALAHQLIGDWGHPLPSLLRATDFSQAHLWQPVDTDLLPRLHSGNLALVGDAAHPLLPFTSQGVAAAIAGVRDLASALEQHCSLPAALETYSASCRARCAPYIGQGRELTRRFLQPDGRADDLLPVST
ncbi:FAD-dependent monooxygenase [Natronosporangium hydrolyticum]|uniref:FAD-dependent monooxygenase n=1 Tax=Natronosporangium hydrolyticum TaxID=2811111 RepID=A0A895YCC5_9ACTN|nr:NAD(P)/FAD-dependent oxidoreductase [Natronosporangium hydrolyticum]QSB15484.1 FAD-dependent monooxygenase [Natronosporangium hydrolyticum]